MTSVDAKNSLLDNKPVYLKLSFKDGVDGNYLFYVDITGQMISTVRHGEIESSNYIEDLLCGADDLHRTLILSKFAPAFIDGISCVFKENDFLMLFEYLTMLKAASSKKDIKRVCIDMLSG